MFKAHFFFQCRTECFCGHNEPLAKYKLPDPECNYKCSGDSKQICGGYFTINVYETGIISVLRVVFTVVNLCNLCFFFNRVRSTSSRIDTQRKCEQSKNCFFINTEWSCRKTSASIVEVIVR